jgi:hypothetical protein
MHPHSLKTLRRSQAEPAGMRPDDGQPSRQAPQGTLTCPLCGQSSAHLFACKGCGGEAWGWTFEATHGETAVHDLRTALAQTLTRAGFDADVAGHAACHSYQPGGCQVCPTCWRQTRPADACTTCPLFLFSERRLEGEGYVPAAYLPASWQGQTRAAWNRAVEARWCEHWNTGDENRALVAQWREGILSCQASGVSGQRLAASC